MRLRLTSFATLLAMLVAMYTSSASSAATIDTISSWSGNNIIWFGEPNTATYGQTITTATTDLFLSQFSFLIDTPTGTSQFAAYVMKWDSINALVTGPILYQSAKTTNSGGWNEISFNPNVLLEPNSQYALFFSASGYFNGQNVQSRFASTGDLYSGGQFIYNNNGNDFSSLGTVGWTTNYIGSGDLAFRATLDATVPEPSTYALAAIAGMTLAGIARRRKK